MEANKCPHCGADKSSGTEFTCGTRTYCNIRGEYCYEQEIERLEADLAWHKRYIDVVLSKAEATLGGVYSLMTTSVSGASSARDIYDAAVRKEM